MKLKLLQLALLVLFGSFLINQQANASTLAINNVSGGLYTGNLQYHYKQITAINTGTLAGIYIEIQGISTGNFIPFYITDDTSHSFASTSCGYIPAGITGIYLIPCGNYTNTINAGDQITIVQTPVYTSDPYISDAGNTFPAIELVDSGGSSGGLAVDQTTKITNVTPQPDSSTASSTSFTFGATGYVNKTDYEQGNTYLYIRYAQLTGASMRSNPWTLLRGEISIPITNSGSFNLSTTTSVIPSGMYGAIAQIDKPYISIFGFTLWTTTLADINWNFEVGTSTQIEKDYAKNLLSTTRLASGTASSTATNLTCNSLTSLFTTDFINCFQYVIIPTDNDLKTDWNQLYNGALSHFPIAYVTTLISIFSTTTQSSLTAIDITLPKQMIGAGSHIRLDLNHSLDWILNATSSYMGNNQTFEDVTMYYWNIIIYFATGMYILSRIIGSGLVSRGISKSSSRYPGGRARKKFTR